MFQQFELARLAPSSIAPIASDIVVPCKSRRSSHTVWRLCTISTSSTFVWRSGTTAHDVPHPTVTCDRSVGCSPCRIGVRPCRRPEFAIWRALVQTSSAPPTQANERSKNTSWKQEQYIEDGHTEKGRNHRQFYLPKFAHIGLSRASEVHRK